MPIASNEPGTKSNGKWRSIGLGLRGIVNCRQVKCTRQPQIGICPKTTGVHTKYAGPTHRTPRGSMRGRVWVSLIRSGAASRRQRGVMCPSGLAWAVAAIVGVRSHMRSSVMVPMNDPADKVRLVSSDVTQIGRGQPRNIRKPWRPGRRRLNHEARHRTE
jgi:hypothetical protein